MKKKLPRRLKAVIPKTAATSPAALKPVITLSRMERMVIEAFAQRLKGIQETSEALSDDRRAFDAELEAKYGFKFGVDYNFNPATFQLVPVPPFNPSKKSGA